MLALMLEELWLCFPVIQTFCFCLLIHTFYKETVQLGMHDDFTLTVSLLCCLSHSQINE